MSLQTSVPLFAGVEDADQLLMAVMEEADKEGPEESISIWNPFYEYMKKKNLIEKRKDIGAYIPVKLMPYANETTQWVSGYDDAKNIPTKLYKQAEFGYGHLTGVQMYNREEVVKSQGESGILDLVSDMEDQLNETMNNDLATALMGSQDADGRTITGLGNIMAVNGACGGLDPTAQGNAFWNPQKIYKTGTTNYALATEFETAMFKANRQLTANGGKDGGRADLVLMGEDVYAATQAYYASKLQTTIGDLQSGKWDGFEMFEVFNQTFIYEPKMAAKNAWFLNTKKGVKMRCHAGTNFTYTPWQIMEGKVQAKKRNCLLYVALYTRDRRLNGELTFT